MKIFQEGLHFFTKPRVVHHIPGRIRLHVPLFKQLSEEARDTLKMVCDLLKTVGGIADVSANHISATLLVHYDSEKVSGEQVLSFIASINKVFMMQQEDLKLLMEKDAETIVACLHEWLQRSVEDYCKLDKTKRIIADEFL